MSPTQQNNQANLACRSRESIAGFAHAMLDRITHIASDLESEKVKAKSLFNTLIWPPSSCAPNANGFLATIEHHTHIHSAAEFPGSHRSVSSSAACF
jgi:hypothetical protein